MKTRHFFWLLKRSLVGAFDDNCLSIAKGVAFSAILSFFPLLLVVAALLFSQKAEAVVREIKIALGQVLPEDAYRLAVQYLHPGGRRTQSILAGAWVVAIWAASDAIVSLMEGFRAAYRLPASWSFLKTRAVALALVLLAGLPLLFATLLLFSGKQIETWLIAHLGMVSWGIRLGWRASCWALALGTSTAVIAILYHMAPNRSQQWRYVWPGAVVATLLWLPATLLFAWYVQYMARYHALYGSISAAVVLLMWMYLVSLIVLVGCEFNAEYERWEVSQEPAGGEA